MASIIQTVSPSSNDSALIQSMLDGVGDNGTVQLERGDYTLQRPLTVPGSVSLLGRGKFQTTLHAAGSAFPPVIHYPSQHAAVPTDGDALVLDGSMSYALNVSADCWFALSLSNITPFKVSCSLWLDSLPTDERFLIGSQGAEGMNPTSLRQAFAVYSYQGEVWLQWNWDGTRQLIQSGQVLTTGTWHDILIQFDGTTASVSVDGAVVASQAAGPIQQAYHEDVFVGAPAWRWPDGSVDMAMPNGKIRNIHMTGSGIGGGTVGDIAPAFDQCSGPLVPIDTGFGRHWTMFRHWGGGDQAGVILKDFSTQGGTGIFLDSAVNSLIDGVYLNEGKNGFVFWNNCYKSVIKNVTTNGGRFGCVWSGACSLMNLDNFQFQGTVAGLVISDGGGRASNGFIYGGNMKTAVMLKGDWPSLLLDSVAFGDEGQTVSPVRGIYASQARGLTILGGGGGYFAFPLPIITLDGCQGVSVNGMLFGIRPDTLGLIEIVSGDEPAIVTLTRVGSSSSDVSGVPLFVTP